MLRSIMLVLAFVTSVYSQPTKQQAPEASAKQDAAKDKARTVAGGASKGIKACRVDLDRWCKDVKPGEGRLGACLMVHEKDLSKKCRRWTEHGGKAHASEALLKDLDGPPAAAPAPKSP
ncbi:MAG: cysteine rich repeat-containing protein [Elusimicrobiota bacterium]